MVASVNNAVRFGTLTQAQKARIAQAREDSSGRGSDNGPSEIMDVLTRYLKPEQPDLSTLPEMDPEFAGQLIAAMRARINNPFRGPLDEEVALKYRKELAETERQLDEAPFRVSEAVVDEIVKRYGVAGLW